ncbi:MAG: hypothetical protein GY928_34425 [Colwellia sp.]|nr:hypothetical protein [Colwellia sp.]
MIKLSYEHSPAIALYKFKGVGVGRGVEVEVKITISVLVIVVCIELDAPTNFEENTKVWIVNKIQVKRMIIVMRYPPACFFICFIFSQKKL